MELQSISQVSKHFAISSRTLRYYEEIGLIQPTKKEDFAYRTYDGDTITRLRRIIVLRKLRIPLKQIAGILDSGDTAVALEAFERSLSELEDEITALSTIRSVIQAFMERLNPGGGAFALPDDASLLEAVDSLTISKIHFKEDKINMQTLHQSGEVLDRFKKKLVRVIYMPPATVAHIHCPYDQYNSDDPWRAYTESKGIMDKFIREADLQAVKPDFRYFGYGHPDYGIMVTIPGDTHVPPPLDKRVYPGGLFAVYTNGPENHDDWNVLHAWLKDNEDYEYDARGKGLEEYYNPRNIHGLQNANTEYYDFHLPIREIQK